MYGFFAYRMRTRADAEDLTQQTFERALKAWPRYDPAKASVGTWLIVIARNLLVDHFRADRSSRQQPLDELDGGHDALVDPGVEPDLGLEPDLERALATLNARERELIALRFGGDLTGPEIAETTGLSLANVQQILSRSLRRMRAVIDAESAADPAAGGSPAPAPRQRAAATLQHHALPRPRVDDRHQKPDHEALQGLLVWGGPGVTVDEPREQ